MMIPSPNEQPYKAHSFFFKSSNDIEQMVWEFTCRRGVRSFSLCVVGYQKRFAGLTIANKEKRAVAGFFLSVFTRMSDGDFGGSTTP
jgi:hypothetical protein